MNGRKPYEGICTESQIMSLIENIDNTKDVEWSDYVIDGEKLSYPMWKAVAASEGDTYEDFLKYFSAVKSNQKEPIKTDDEKVGIVKPEDDFEDQTEVDVFTESATPTLIFGGEDLAAKIKRLMGNNHVISDKTGVVKPTSEGMPSKTTKQVIDSDSTKPNEAVVEIAKKAKAASVGSISPSDAFTAQTKVDVASGKGLSKGPNQVSDQTGIVKPKSDFGGSTKPEIKIDATKTVVKTENAPKKANPSVGMIKPESDIKPNPKPITFKNMISK